MHEQVLKCDANAEFNQQANLVGSCTVGNFTMVMVIMTVHTFPVAAYQDQKRYMRRYSRKPKTLKVYTFTSRLIHLNNIIPYFPPDCIWHMVAALPDDEIEEILYHTMPNMWRKKMTEQRYNYLDRSIQDMSGFFETRIENLETIAPPPKEKDLQEIESLNLWGFWCRFLRRWKKLLQKNFCQYNKKIVIQRTNVLYLRP